MKPLVVSLLILVILCACDRAPQRGLPLPGPSPAVVPTPAPPQPPPPPLPVGARVIALGEVVRDSVGEEPRTFVVTTPATGTLLVHLEWFELSGAVTLRLAVDRSEIAWQCGMFAPWPVEARVAVVSGQQVLITVSRGGGCWDYVSVKRGPSAAEPMDFVVSTKMAG